MTDRTAATANENETTRVGRAVRRLKPGAAAGLLILAVAGVSVLGLPATGSGSADDTTVNVANAEEHNDVIVEINCTASEVRVSAPDDSEYGLSVVTVDRAGSSTSTSRQTPLSGNQTVEVSEAEVVYAFVTDPSTGEPITSAVEQCEELPGANATDDPSITIDCDERTVRFTAPEDVSYTARVSSVDVTPSGASTSTVSQTTQGNTTVSVEADLVIAFASTDATDEPVSAIRDCSRIADADLASADESCLRDSPNS